MKVNGLLNNEAEEVIFVVTSDNVVLKLPKIVKFCGGDNLLMHNLF